MHLRNSCDRFTSSCIIRYSPGCRSFGGVNDGISLAFSWLNETSVPKSRMTGKVRSGVTVMVSVGSNVDIRVMHRSLGLPLISAEHDPHLPALQFHRTA